MTRESGSVIGNSLKSLYSRITSIQPAIDSMADIGINIKTSAGEMRDVGSILDDLGAKWSTLSAEQQQNLGLQIAGRFQLSRFLILMNQYETALESTATAENSAGSGYRENAQYLKSYSAQINMVKNAWVEAVLSMKDSGLGDAMIIGLKAGLEFFKALTSIIDKVGILPVILGTAGVAFAVFSDKARIASSSINTFAIGSLSKVPLAGGKAVSSLSAMSIGMQRLSSTSAVASVSLGVLRTALSFAFPIVAIMAVGAAISAITDKVVEHKQAQKDLKDQMEKTIQADKEAITTNKDQVDSLIKSYSRLSEEKKSGEWNIEKDQEYLAIQKELGELFPSLISSIDKKGRTHLIEADSIGEVVGRTKELLEAERALQLLNAKDEYKTRIDNINKQTKAIEKQEKALKTLIKWKEESDKGKPVLESDGFGGQRIVGSKEIEQRIWESKQAIKQGEVILAGAYSSLNSKMEEIYTVGLSQSTDKIIPKIRENMQRVLAEMDIGNFAGDMNPYEMELVVEQVDSFTKKLNQAFKARDEQDFNKITEEMKDYLATQELESDIIDRLIPKYKEMQEAVQIDAENKKLAGQETDEYGESMDGIASSADKADDALKKLTSSISYINGVLEDYQESNRLSESTLLELIDKYPQLIAYLGDEAELIRQLEGIRDADKNATIKQLALKLSKSEEFYKENISLIKQFIDQQNGFYKGDLNNFKNLAEAKAFVEKMLILNLSKQWGAYYNAVSKMFEVPLQASNHSFHIPGMDAEQDKIASANANALDRMLKANEALKDFRGTWEDFEIGQIAVDFDSLGTSLDKNTKSTKNKTKAEKDAAKAMEESTFRADKYKRAMEELNLEIKKQQDIQSQFPDYSFAHVEALQAEIKLQKEKDKLLENQEKNLQAQIKAGKILKTGVVTTKTGGGSQKLSGWDGSITSQYGKRFHPIDKVWKNHDGIDIRGKNGTRVDSNVSGTVTFAGNKGNGLGNYVAIKDASGNTNIYGHLEKVLVKAGQSIAQGVALGTIGSTGKSTGNHLHYQVNDPSGKSINPSSYVDSARKGVSEASKEVAQVYADIDGAKSELIALQGQRIDEQAKLRELEAKLISTTLSPFENRRKQSQQIIEFEIAKLKEIDVQSDRYGKTLDKISTHLKSKQRVNQEEIVALEKLIRTGGLTGDTLAQMKDRVWALKTEMFGLNEEINNIDLDRLNAVMGEHDDIISEINYEYQRSQALLALYSEGTADYNEQLSNSIEFQKQERDAVKAKIEALQQEILTVNLSAEALKDKKKEIQDNTLQYWNLASAVINAEKSLEASRKKLAEDAADAMISAYKSYISEKRDMTMRSYDELSREEDKRHKQQMDNYKKELDAFRKIIQEKLDAIDKEESERSYSKDIDKLEEERLKVLNRLNLLSLDDSLEAKAERKKLSEELAKIDDDLFEKRNAKEVADRKDNLNSMLKDKEEQVQKEEQLADEQHEAAKDRIDKEKRYWDQFYTDQLNDERKFAKMKEDIVAGNFDKMSAEFQEYIKEMEDTMPELLDTLDGTMQAVGSSIRQNLIDNLREALDMLAKVDANNIATANPAPGGQGSHGTGAGGTHGSSPSQSVSTLNSADLQVLTGKYMNDRLADQTKNPVTKGKVKEKAYELANKGRASGSTISSSEGFDSIIAGLSQADKALLGQHLQGSGSQHVSTPELQDIIKRFGQSLMNSSMKLNTGGYVKKGANGLAMLHEEEVVLNKPETKKLFDTLPILEKLNALLSPLTMPRVNAPELAGAGGGTVNNFEIIIEKMTGTKRDVDNFMDEIDNRLKRKGLR